MNVLSEYGNFARSRPVQIQNFIQQHRLAGARAPDQSHDLPPLDRQVDAVMHHMIAKHGPHAADFNDRFVAHTPISRYRSAKIASITTTAKMDCTTEAVVRFPSDSTLPPTFSP